MNEEDFLKKFAKALGAEDALSKIEQKKIQEEKMLRGMAALFGQKDLLNELETKKAREEAELKEKREREAKLLDQMNTALARLVDNNPQHAEVIQQEVKETLVAVAQIEEEPITIEAVDIKEEEEVVIAEDAAQPKPELPKDDIITKSVTAISKAAPGEVQKIVDALPAGIRKELNIIKRSITDLHRFATNHSQLGGGGEVKLARLDDVDATSIADGLYLRYDLANNMFVFDTPAGANGTGGDANNAAYLGGYAANQYSYANALSAFQTTAGLGANVATLTANNASYLGTVAAASYVQNTDSRTLSGNLNFTGVNNYFTNIYVGANVFINATHIFVSTNATMNLVMTANQITLNGANVITTSTVSKIFYANGIQAYP